MAKVMIASLDEAPTVDTPRGFTGRAKTQALFERDKAPLHVHQHIIGRDAQFQIGPKDTDCMVYVWKGTVEAGGKVLSGGSSLIVEHGASIEVRGRDESSQLLTFSAARPPGTQRAGGHVHLLPREHVPRVASLPGTTGVGGAMHADASCPTCELWLHENSIPAPKEEVMDPEQGVHSHTEDEVIFVIDGQMRLGARLCGPGTAISIAANTLYTFGVGPEELKFINFRAGLPSEIKFKNGRTMDEVAFWRNGVGTPKYLEPVGHHH